MKTKIQTILLSMGVLFGLTLCAEPAGNPEAEVRSCIQAFVKAGDTYDAQAVDAVLNENYRVVMNRLFGSSDIMLIDKATYIEKISTKEWGGDKRKVEILAIAVNGPNATAKVSLVGAQTKVTSIFSLVQDAKGHWTLISDIPVFEK